MAASTIVTGQFVRIRQTPASLGERFLAFLVDVVLLIIYEISMLVLVNKLNINATSDAEYIALFFVFSAPLFYFLLCEIFNRGQSFGKFLLNTRVVKADGSTPGLGAYLLRWILFPIDIQMSGGVGMLSILLTRNNQRLGDQAAGTLVIKEKNYKRIQVSLDEFDHLGTNYQPVYPQASELSLDQVDVITRTLASDKDYQQRVAQLAAKVRSVFSIASTGTSDEQFLQTLLRDYQYFALEDI